MMRWIAASRGRRMLSLALLALACGTAPGCGGGDGLARQPISGSVKLDGKPLEKGQIDFFPSGPSEIAVPSGAPISGGSYSISQADGLVPGTYVVRISSAGAPPGQTKKFAGEAVGEMPGLGPLNAQELVPAKYNAESELKAEVKAGGTNKFDFDLTK